MIGEDKVDVGLERRGYETMRQERSNNKGDSVVLGVEYHQVIGVRFTVSCIMLCRRPND